MPGRAGRDRWAVLSYPAPFCWISHISYSHISYLSCPPAVLSISHTVLLDILHILPMWPFPSWHILHCSAGYLIYHIFLFPWCPVISYTVLLDISHITPILPSCRPDRSYTNLLDISRILPISPPAILPYPTPFCWISHISYLSRPPAVLPYPTPFCWISHISHLSRPPSRSGISHTVLMDM